MFAIYISIGLAAGAIAIWWALASPRIALVTLCISMVLGQVGRVPLPGQGGGLLFSDIAVVLVLVAAGARAWRTKAVVSKQVQRTAMCIAVFLLWGLFPLFLQAHTLGLTGMGIAVAYWVRLAMYLSLLPALLVLFASAELRSVGERFWWWSASILAGVGLLQVAVAPSLASIPAVVAAGWDPHINRLVSTWFDPNFIGAFFSMAVIYGLFLVIDTAFDKRKKWIAVVVVLCSVALIATRSRSSFIALAGALVGVSPVVLLHLFATTGARIKKAIHVLVFFSCTLLVGAAGAGLLGDRFLGLVTYDPTVHLRAESLLAGWEVFGRDSAVIGEGYNAYQFAAVREGIGDSFAVHSRAGLDNSVLTLWATVGIPGIILFFLPWVYVVMLGWRSAWRDSTVVGLVPLALLVFLSIHAQFVNSLLYGHLLVVLALLVSLSIQKSSSV